MSGEATVGATLKRDKNGKIGQTVGLIDRFLKGNPIITPAVYLDVAEKIGIWRKLTTEVAAVFVPNMMVPDTEEPTIPDNAFEFIFTTGLVSSSRAVARHGGADARALRDIVDASAAGAGMTVADAPAAPAASGEATASGAPFVEVSFQREMHAAGLKDPLRRKAFSTLEDKFRQLWRKSHIYVWKIHNRTLKGEADGAQDVRADHIESHRIMFASFCISYVASVLTDRSQTREDQSASLRQLDKLITAFLQKKELVEATSGSADVNEFVELSTRLFLGQFKTSIQEFISLLDIKEMPDLKQEYTTIATKGHASVGHLTQLLLGVLFHARELPKDLGSLLSKLYEKEECTLPSEDQARRSVELRVASMPTPHPNLEETESLVVEERKQNALRAFLAMSKVSTFRPLLKMVFTQRRYEDFKLYLAQPSLPGQTEKQKWAAFIQEPDWRRFEGFMRVAVGFDTSFEAARRYAELDERKEHLSATELQEHQLLHLELMRIKKFEWRHLLPICSDINLRYLSDGSYAFAPHAPGCDAGQVTYEGVADAEKDLAQGLAVLTALRNFISAYLCGAMLKPKVLQFFGQTTVNLAMAELQEADVEMAYTAFENLQNGVSALEKALVDVLEENTGRIADPVGIPPAALTHIRSLVKSLGKNASHPGFNLVKQCATRVLASAAKVKSGIAMLANAIGATEASQHYHHSTAILRVLSLKPLAAPLEILPPQALEAMQHQALMGVEDGPSRRRIDYGRVMATYRLAMQGSEEGRLLDAQRLMLADDSSATLSPINRHYISLIRQILEELLIKAGFTEPMAKLAGEALIAQLGAMKKAYNLKVNDTEPAAGDEVFYLLNSLLDFVEDPSLLPPEEDADFGSDVGPGLAVRRRADSGHSGIDLLTGQLRDHAGRIVREESGVAPLPAHHVPTDVIHAAALVLPSTTPMAAAAVAAPAPPPPPPGHQIVTLPNDQHQALPDAQIIASLGNPLGSPGTTTVYLANGSRLAVQSSLLAAPVANGHHAPPHAGAGFGGSHGPTGT